MTQKGSVFSSLAKGLFVGALLGAGIVVFHKSRNGTRLNGNLPLWEEPSQSSQPLSPKESKRHVYTEARAKPGNGWRVMYYVASAVAMISDWQMKKKRSISHD